MRNPANFAGARVIAWLGEDPLLLWFDGGPALRVDLQAGLPASSMPATSTPIAQVLNCAIVNVGVGTLFPQRRKGLAQSAAAPSARARCASVLRMNCFS